MPLGRDLAILLPIMFLVIAVIVFVFRNRSDLLMKINLGAVIFAFFMGISANDGFFFILLPLILFSIPAQFVIAAIRFFKKQTFRSLLLTGLLDVFLLIAALSSLPDSYGKM